MVRTAGVEPALPEGKRILSPLRDQRGAALRGQAVEVMLTPLEGRQIAGARHAKKRPLRFAAFEGDKKPAVQLRHLANDGADQQVANSEELLLGDGLLRHPGEAAQEFAAGRLQPWGKH
jgi:hypothetical protein